MTKLYLAYGSNLDHFQMQLRCPDARYLGATDVKDYALLFRGNARGWGVATIEPEKGSHVPAGIWEISDLDEAALDIYEGWPRLYEKQDFVVKLGGKSITAMAYIMTKGHPFAAPNKAYRATLRRGYRNCKLDRNVLETAISRAEKLAE